MWIWIRAHFFYPLAFVYLLFRVALAYSSIFLEHWQRSTVTAEISCRWGAAGIHRKKPYMFHWNYTQPKSQTVRFLFISFPRNILCISGCFNLEFDWTVRFCLDFIPFAIDEVITVRIYCSKTGSTVFERTQSARSSSPTSHSVVVWSAVPFPLFGAVWDEFVSGINSLNLISDGCCHAHVILYGEWSNSDRHTADSVHTAGLIQSRGGVFYGASIGAWK